MTQSFFVPGPLPGMNEILAHAKTRYGATNAYKGMKQYIDTMIWTEIKAAKIKPCLKPVMIHFAWYEKEATRDPDNIRAGAKFCLDALVTAKVLVKDSQKWIKGLSDDFHVNKYAPGVRVTISEL